MYFSLHEEETENYENKARLKYKLVKISYNFGFLLLGIVRRRTVFFRVMKKLRKICQ